MTAYPILWRLEDLGNKCLMLGSSGRVLSGITEKEAEVHDCAFIRDLGFILYGIGNLRGFCLFPFFFNIWVL